VSNQVIGQFSKLMHVHVRRNLKEGYSWVKDRHLFAGARRDTVQIAEKCCAVLEYKNMRSYLYGLLAVLLMD
jgi:hypothetical protein